MPEILETNTITTIIRPGPILLLYPIAILPTTFYAARVHISKQAGTFPWELALMSQLRWATRYKRE